MGKQSHSPHSNQANTTAAPGAERAAPSLRAPLTNEATPLVDEIKAIAAGVTSLAKHFTSKEVSDWHALALKVKPFVVALSVLIGALFATEQFLASQQEAESSRAEVLFSAATEHLASPQEAIQAAAVHALPRLATFRDVSRPEPGDYFFGSHLINRFVRTRREYPFMQRAWTLFREFAAQPRTPTTVNPLTEDIVSSAILREGAAWEMRQRMETRITDPGMGSLLYKAKMPNAYGIDLDFRHINFGGVDLSNSNLSASKFDDCGFSAASLEGAIFSGASLKRAYLADAKLERADFSFAFLDHAILMHATLQGAKFTQTSLTGADFTDSKLDGATFSQAIAHHATFRNASLRNAIFKQADISSAVFEGADVEGTDFTTSIGFTNGTLAGARNAEKARVSNTNATQRRSNVP